MKLLLINPRFPESFWTMKWAIDTFLPDVRAVSPPLGLATLAALCPDDWKVEIIDENIEPVPLDTDADIVGVCGMGVQFERQKELLKYYRRSGRFVVAGGSYASLCPERYEALADVVVSGEAEYTWPVFCADVVAGAPRRLYREGNTVSLDASPTPRFDLLDASKYAWMTMQFSRGCPFRCEFCDIIVMFGRKPRTKSVEQIGRELDAMRALDIHNVFFVDDNLIGNPRAAKQLLRYLIAYQKRHDYYFRFGTEASLNMAADAEMLTLLRAAQFAWVFVGIESPDENSLREAGKVQNLRQDMLSSVREIYRHGIDVTAGFIIGFDNDTTDVFEKQYDFVVEAGIRRAMIGLLLAMENTPLYERLQKDGRLVPNRMGSDNAKLATNVLPWGMTYNQMIAGYRDLCFRLQRYPTIAQRIRNKNRYLVNPVPGNSRPAAEILGIVAKLVREVVKQAGLAGLYHVVRSIPFSKPELIAQVFTDWIHELSTRDYIARHFAGESDRQRRLARAHLSRIERKLGRYIHRGRLRVALSQDAGAPSELWFCINGRPEQVFFRRAARALEKMLRDTRTCLLLQIESCDVRALPQLRDILERLSSYGDRIRIMADDASRRIINVDSSRFTLILAPVPVPTPPHSSAPSV